MKTDSPRSKRKSLLPSGGDTGLSWMHLTCIHAVERAQRIFLRPGRKQDEGDFISGFKIPLTPTLPMNPRPKAATARVPLPLGEGMRVREEIARLKGTIRGNVVWPGGLSRRERVFCVGVHFVRRTKQTGVTLVELIAFIVVAALLATGLIAAFTSAMRSTPKSGEITQALQIAQERMELILAYKKSKGFTALIDPCTLASPPAQCTPPSGYSVSVPFPFTNWNGSAEYKTVTVDVTGLQNITLTAVVASY